MTETPTLDELVEKAATRHNGASGRRLAEIAQQGGHEVSHATLNRIRRGTYSSTPTDQTLQAIAFLAGVDSQVAYAALAAQHEDTRLTAELYYRWARLQLESRRVMHEYAHARGIDSDDAEEELAEIFEMDGDRRYGRPWTPPWDPGPEYGEDDTPWLRKWWSEEPKLVDLGYPDSRFAGMKVHQISLPRWMHEVGADTPGTESVVSHVLARHRGARNFALVLDTSSGEMKNVVYLAVDDPAQFNTAAAQEDLQGFLGDDRRTFELVVLDELPVTPNGKLDLPRLRAVRQEVGEPDAGPVFDQSRMLAAMAEPEHTARTADEAAGSTPADNLKGGEHE